MSIKKLKEVIMCNVDVVMVTFFFRIKLQSSVGCCMQLLMRNGCTLAVTS